MKILCLFSKYPSGANVTNITKDLALALAEQGHDVTVATLLERKYKKKTFLESEDGVKILRIKTGNMFNNVSKYEKFITTLFAPSQMYKAIKKYFSNEKFQLIITHTPFVSDPSLVGRLKREHGAKTLLMLWDIFPQNALDLGLLKKGLLFNLLKKKELKMLAAYDLINCMSQGNYDYLLDHYDSIEKEKLLITPNWAKITSSEAIVENEKLRQKYGFSMNDKICIFGGNIGRPQKVENILEVANYLRSDKNTQFVFVGQGTEIDKLRQQIEARALSNVKILDYMPRKEYEHFLQASDVGLVSLDERFTVPNFPSKSTDYLKNKLPIFALLDKVSYSDFGDVIANVAKAGCRATADNLKTASESLQAMLNEPSQLQQFAQNGRNYFEQTLDVDKAAKKIVDSIKSD